MHWVGTWTAAPAPAEGGAFANQTLRMNPRVSIGGSRIRVRLSNAYGLRPLTIGAAHFGLRAEGPAIIADTNRALTFGGASSASVAAGAVLLSDPVELNLPALADVAVSIYLPAEVPASFGITGRYARQTNYISPPGDFLRRNRHARGAAVGRLVSSSAALTFWHRQKPARWSRWAIH